MARFTGWLLLAAAALIVAATGCGVSVHSSGTSGRYATPAPTLTVPGDPSARVTDVAIRGLTTQQIREIEIKCSQGLVIPGTDQDCISNMQLYLRKSSLECGPPSRLICVAIGIIAGQNLGFFKETDSRGGGPTCAGNGAGLCRGLTVPESTVHEVLVPASSPGASSSASPSPTPSGTGSLAPSVPPTTPFSGPPPSFAQTAAGSSP